MYHRSSWGVVCDGCKGLFPGAHAVVRPGQLPALQGKAETNMSGSAVLSCVVSWCGWKKFPQTRATFANVSGRNNSCCAHQAIRCVVADVHTVLICLQQSRDSWLVCQAVGLQADEHREMLQCAGPVVMGFMGLSRRVAHLARPFRQAGVEVCPVRIPHPLALDGYVSRSGNRLTRSGMGLTGRV
jgi:hypothetical protein